MINKYTGAQMGVNHYKQGCKLNNEELAAVLKKKWDGVSPIHCPKCYVPPSPTR